ncbi:hypothetical protein D1007_24333 [Hordeum vulgare]|nr:hypothetical protein D1007_24333 [Hordeum vulgare]
MISLTISLTSSKDRHSDRHLTSQSVVLYHGCDYSNSFDCAKGVLFTHSPRVSIVTQTNPAYGISKVNIQNQYTPIPPPPRRPASPGLRCEGKTIRRGGSNLD